jgi:hypothetical protein
MNTYYVQYHSRTAAALATRNRQQTLPLNLWEFNFPQLAAKVVLTDSIKSSDHVNLHTGLTIIIHLQGSSMEDVKGLSKNFAEMLLNLVTFSTLAFCDAAKLVSLIDATGKKTWPAMFYNYPTEGTEVVPSLRVINHNHFGELFEAYDKSPDKERVSRALSWLRKGINQLDSIDEFICYWTGLEVIRHFFRRDPRFIRGKKGDEWDGVKYIFTKELSITDFDLAKEARIGLFHGTRELDNTFVQEIGTYRESLRKGLIFCIGILLNMTNASIMAVVNRIPKRIPLETWTLLKGTLKDLPSDFDELVKNYPSIAMEKVEKQFTIGPQGNLSVTLNAPHRFNLPKGGKFNAQSIEYWG